MANDKFQRRFEGMERSARARGKKLNELTLADMERLWQAEKIRRPPDRHDGHDGHDGHEESI
jgi:uncharacterized protein YabN with tetrapyrrole methylase and pyrophosphatase domain